MGTPSPQARARSSSSASSRLGTKRPPFRDDEAAAWVIANISCFKNENKNTKYLAIKVIYATV
jgi:hypothetical protein